MVATPLFWKHFFFWIVIPVVVPVAIIMFADKDFWTHVTNMEVKTSGIHVGFYNEKKKNNSNVVWKRFALPVVIQ